MSPVQKCFPLPKRICTAAAGFGTSFTVPESGTAPGGRAERWQSPVTVRKEHGSGGAFHISSNFGPIFFTSEQKNISIPFSYFLL